MKRLSMNKKKNLKKKRIESEKIILICAQLLLKDMKNLNKLKIYKAKSIKFYYIHLGNKHFNLHI